MSERDARQPSDVLGNPRLGQLCYRPIAQRCPVDRVSMATVHRAAGRSACLPLFAIGVDPRFDYFSGVRSLDNLALLRRTASQLRKAKP